LAGACPAAGEGGVTLVTRFVSVMPGLVPGIRVFIALLQEDRGWPE
jgi:hypothetical protein